MNTTSDQQRPPGPAPHQDLDRLRRSVSDRYIAGVAGGLGRHFDIDPTVIRVLLAVLTLFGGAGAFVYAACWCFVPEEGKDRAGITIGSDARKIVLLAAAGVAGLLAVGDAFSGFNAGWPIAAVAVVIAVVLIARDKRSEGRSQSDQEWNRYAADVSHEWNQYGEKVAQDWNQYARDVTDHARTDPPAAGDGTPGATPPVPPSWQPPTITPPFLPPHPKRTGILWFWPTVALIAIALGVVGLIDQSRQVDVGVYPAVALAVVGVMLLIGSLYGRPGGLVFLGVMATGVLAAATVLGSFRIDGRQIDERPTSAAAVESAYDVTMGQIELDLTAVTDATALAGRTIDLEVNAGQVTVIVPRSLNVRIEAELGFAGGITIPGYDGGGFEAEREKYVAGTPANDLAPLELDIDVRVGQILVEQR